ncbi:DNA recombination protein RmuC [Nitrospira sp. Nam80]
MEIGPLVFIVALLIGSVLGAGILWAILSPKILVAHERGRSEGQVELATMRERLAQSDRELENLKGQLNKLATSSDESRIELESAHQLAASLTAKVEQIPLLVEALGQSRQELKAAEGKLAATHSDLACVRENRDGLSAQVAHLKSDVLNQEDTISALRAERDSLAKRATELEITLKTQREQSDKDLALLTNAKEALTLQFRSIATEILEQNSTKFTNTNKQELTAILNPLAEKLVEFKNKVEQTYNIESQQRYSLKQEIEKLAAMATQLDTEARNLTKALKGDSKMRGTWGEVILERLLEHSGLTKDREYRIQQNFEQEDGTRIQPDVVLDLPQKRNIVIDSKVSLIAYERFVSTEDSSLRQSCLNEHVNALRGHVQNLSGKNYHNLYQLNSLDFVLMFVPIEPAFYIAMQEEPAIFTDALAKSVVIVTPATLLATLRTIAYTWRHEYRSRNAQEIAKQAASLYDKFASFAVSLEQVGLRLDQARAAHDQAFKQLKTGKGNLVQQVERFRELGVHPSKTLPVSLLDSAPNEEEKVEPLR